MKKRFACRCLLCQLESHLKTRLQEPLRLQQYAAIANGSTLLSAFPSVPALTAHLRTCRSNGSGSHPADAILSELLRLFQSDEDHRLLRDVLLLLFIPSLHRASRQVTGRYPLLLPDDTAQNLVVCLLEVLRRGELRRRNSHLAFAISRMLKRSAFEWAQKETRSQACLEAQESFPELDGVTAEPLERAVLLRHFLFRCHRKGLLTGPDLALLIHIKLEGDVGVLYSNALRQKIKRLLAKLRRAAQATTSKQIDSEHHQPL